jgi:hypothetical protein
MHDKGKDRQSKKGETETDVQELKLRVRSDLYRAFHRCVWITVHETGMPPDRVHNMFIEDLLKLKGC